MKISGFRIPGLKAWRGTLCIGGMLVMLIAALPYMIMKNHTPSRGINIRVSSDPSAISGLKLLLDETGFDTHRRERVFRHQIFDTFLYSIAQAERFIYLDVFLWNDWQGTTPELHRSLSTDLAHALIAKKKSDPNIDILALTDPINRAYGNQEPSLYEQMVSNGICVVFTDLSRLPDSNPIYSRPARFLCAGLKKLGLFQSFLGKPRIPPILNHEGPRMSLDQLGRLFHFKANHRKMMTWGQPDGGAGLLVTSFNPADGSSAHSNIGIMLSGSLACEVTGHELDVVEWSSNHHGNILEKNPGDCTRTVGSIRKNIADCSEDFISNDGIEWLTEGRIKEAIIELLLSSTQADKIRIALFYLSDRQVIDAIKKAAMAGADIRIILDANRDAFGREKNGIPNRPVAAELSSFAMDEDLSLAVRWADTHGEQFHTKAMSITGPGKYQLICGSANWTRRNIDNYNLEANILLDGPHEPVIEYNGYFDRIWANSDGFSHTQPYSTFATRGFPLFWKTLLYRIQEKTGLSTF